MSDFIKKEEESDEENELLLKHEKNSCLYIKFNSKTLAKDECIDLTGEYYSRDTTKRRNIETVQFGAYDLDTAFYSPYPEEYGIRVERLYVCEYCLKYMKIERSYRYHMGECTRRAPPGLEIYHNENKVIYEVDAKSNRLYCQNLCLLAKLFIDHKTVFYDVEQFLFYVLCDVDKHGAHLRGYFSKEKDSLDGYNLACIVILPPFQSKGLGHLLIGFSYELSKLEGVPGSPERPLSKMGALSYHTYWSWVIIKILQEFKGTITVNAMSLMSGITEMDIINTMKSMSLLKFWSKSNTACITPAMIEEAISSGQCKVPRLTVDPAAIKWSPPPKDVIVIKSENFDKL